MIDKLIFTVLNPETIRKMSVAKITKTDLYDQEGYPIEGGLMDPRLGVIDPGLRCRTCGGTVGECEGHFGHLELTRPVIHVHYAKLVHNILKVTCRKCGKVLLDEKNKEKFLKGKKSFKKLKSLVKPKCPYCGEEQNKIKFIKPTTIVEGSTILNALEVRERLERIPDEDLIYLGLKNVRPEWFVITLLPIPPVTVRPSITLETGERSEDDLTHKLVDIVRINKRLRENIDLGAPDFIIEDLWELVQYHVATYMNNEITGVPPARHRSGRILKTLTQRLKTKEGRFRHNLIGKRVNYSARTVISPDPMLDIDEVGVPLVIAKELTLPVVVNEKNINHLKDLIRQYPEWPTINYVIKPDGRKKKVIELNKNEIADELDIGYTVEKQLEDGDWALFNRQPSLHRMSIMGHRIKVMPYKTFRMNLTTCPAYNADFDGDEMNLHIPQTQEAQTEIKLLMRVPLNIRSPRFSGPIIGCDKDNTYDNSRKKWYYYTYDCESTENYCTFESQTNVGGTNLPPISGSDYCTGSYGEIHEKWCYIDCVGKIKDGESLNIFGTTTIDLSGEKVWRIAKRVDSKEDCENLAEDYGPSTSVLICEDHNLGTCKEIRENKDGGGLDSLELISKISSLKIPINCIVVVYDHEDFSGNSLTFRGPVTIEDLSDYPYLEDDTWNDKINSIELSGMCAKESKCSGSDVSSRVNEYSDHLLGRCEDDCDMRGCVEVTSGGEKWCYYTYEGYRTDENGIYSCFWTSGEQRNNAGEVCTPEGYMLSSEANEKYPDNNCIVVTE